MEPSQFRSYETEVEAYDEDTNGAPLGAYRFGRSSRDHSIPLFLTDPDGDPDPTEFGAPLKPRRFSLSTKILASVIGAAAVAVLFALFTSDDMRGIVVDAKASFAAVLPGPSAAAQPESVQLTAKDIQLKDPTRLSGPASQTAGASPQAAPAQGAQTPNVQPPAGRNVAIAMAPSRDEITNAYQSALQNRAPAAAPPVVAAAPTVTAPQVPQVRRLDPDELATLMSRAKGLLAAGDIPPARLLLERAADAQDAGAALLLAQTYDPVVLGTQDARNIVPDLALAKSWYQRAMQLGSAEAQRRLSQMQN